MRVPEKTSDDDAKAALARALEQIHGRHVVGIWDTKVAAPHLGGVLILLAELDLLRRTGGAASASIAFVGRKADGAPGLGARVDAMAQVANSAAAVVRCLDCADIAEAVQLIDPRNPDSVAAWPTRELGARHRYESMEIIQDLYEISREFPMLEIHEEALASARRLLDEHAPGRPRIAVHLKMSAPLSSDMSNADMPVWEQFFREAGNRATFVLVGQDPVPNTIATLGNVRVAGRLGASVVDQLGLIRLCDAFMGMASGPCQVAIFGRKPYAVFKNPGHHGEEMAKQMRGPSGSGFSFSLPSQLLIRRKETPWLLSSHYQELVRGYSTGGESKAMKLSGHE